MKIEMETEINLQIRFQMNIALEQIRLAAKTKYMSSIL